MIGKKENNNSKTRLDTMCCALIRSLLDLNYCTVCNKILNFEPFGSQKRSRALCPSCKSLERHRLFYIAMSDVFCYSDLSLLYIGADKNFSKMIEEDFAGETLSFNPTMDFSDIACQKKTYDLIVCDDIWSTFEFCPQLSHKIESLLSEAGYFLTLVSKLVLENHPDIFDFKSDILTKHYSSKEIFSEEQILVYSIQVSQTIVVCKRCV